MLLLKIANKSFFSHNLITSNYMKNLFRSIGIFEFVKEETFSFYVR